MKRPGKFWRDIISNLVANMIWLVLISVPAIAGTVYSVFKIVAERTNGNNFSYNMIILLIISLTVCVCCTVFNLIYFLKKPTRPSFPNIVPDVKYDKIRVELFFKDRENIFCTRDVRFTVLCDKLEHIDKNFTWTGSGYKETVLVKSNGQYCVVDSKMKPTMHKYSINFNTCKKRGDKISYKVKTCVEDIEHIMQPFLSHTVKSPTNILELAITAPENLLKDVKHTIYADTFAEIPISKPNILEKKGVGNLETYECTINAPNLLYNYRIEWKFALEN